VPRRAKVRPRRITRAKLLQKRPSAVKAYIRVIYAEPLHKRAVIRGSLSFPNAVPFAVNTLRIDQSRPYRQRIRYCARCYLSLLSRDRDLLKYPEIPLCRHPSPLCSTLPLVNIA